MPIEVIVTYGTFVDILVPLEYAPYFKEQITKDPICQLDHNNCCVNGQLYQIRVTCRTLGHGKSAQLIKYLINKFGLEGAKEKDQ